MKDIKLRIKSVESTMQITKAMELVASSKLKKARDRMEGARPYFLTLYGTLSKLAAYTVDFSSPFVQQRPVAAPQRDDFILDFRHACPVLSIPMIHHMPWIAYSCIQ